MKKLIILLLITTIVFVITSEGFSKINFASDQSLLLPTSNTKPVAINDLVSMCVNESNTLVNVQGNDSDADGDLLATTILTGPTNGTAILVGNHIKYTPFNNFTGIDIITYKVCDNATPSLCDTAIVTINVNSLPIVNLGLDRIICSGDSVSLGTPSIQGYNYNWAPTINLSMPTIAEPLAFPTATINYVLTVINSNTGCYNNDTIKINVNSLPVGDAGNDDTICLGVSVVLGSPPIIGNTYLWNDEIGLDSVNLAQPNATPIIETTYYLTITDSNTGCHKTDSVHIVLSPIVESNAGNLSKICVGEFTGIGASPTPGYTYSWLPGESLDSDTISSPMASPLVTTMYQLTVTDIASGCQSIDLVQVKVFPMPVVLGGPDVSICLGDSAVIGVVQDSNDIFVWEPAAGLNSVTLQQPMAKPTSTTTYAISVSNQGCKVRQTLTVTVLPKPLINAGTDKTTCVDASAEIGTPGTSGNTYSWFPPEGLSSTSIPQPTATVTETSTFNLTVVNDSTGCVSKDSITLTINTAFTNSPLESQTINLGESIIIGTSPGFGISYNWSPSTGLNSTEVSQPIANPLVTTTYTLTETDASTGCVLRGSVIVNVLTEAICDTTLYNGISPNGDGIDDFWKVPMLICYPINEVIILNRWSNEVWKNNNYDSESVRWNGQNMDGQDLPDGVYYYIISYDGKKKTGWVILKR